jgi:hypothetical protein
MRLHSEPPFPPGAVIKFDAKGMYANDAEWLSMTIGHLLDAKPETAAEWSRIAYLEDKYVKLTGHQLKD